MSVYTASENHTGNKEPSQYAQMRTYVERVQVRGTLPTPERLHRPREELPRLLLELQQGAR